MVAELTRFYAEKGFHSRMTAVCRLAVLCLFVSASWPAAGQWTLEEKAQVPLGQSRDNWVPLDKDKIHDPYGPALDELQQPGEVLSQLPATLSGNKVLWAKALDRGAISPRRSLTPTGNKVQVLDMDVLLDLHGSMNVVRFPHKIHTEWLACNNCHEQLFKSQIGANKITMFNILTGEQCGLCHGAVAFPVTQCPFCHSVERPNDNAWGPTK